MKNLSLFLFSCACSFSGYAQQLPEFEWANYSIGSGSVSTYVYASAYDNNGNSFVLGAFNNQSGVLDIDHSAGTVLLNGYVGMFIAKYDPNGVMLWGNPIGITGTSAQPMISPNHIACDDSGNVYITGAVTDVIVDFDLSTTSNIPLTTAGGFDLFLAKYNPAGASLWSLLIGSTAHEEGNGIVCDGDAVYIAGQYGCNTDFDPGPGIHIPPISQFCVSGFLARYTSNGDFVWQNSYCGPSLSDAGFGIPSSVKMNSQHDLVICGRMGGVVDFNPGAGLDTLSVYPTGGNDGFFAKFDTSGNFAFAKQLATISNYVYPIADVDHNDNIIVAGSFTGITDFDPGTGIFADTAMNVGGDAFIAKYDGNGNLTWQKSFGSAAAEDLSVMAIDSANNILVGGLFQDSLDVDFGPGAYYIDDVNNSPGLFDGYVIKYDPAGALVFGFAISGFAYEMVGGLDCYNDRFIVSGKISTAWDFDPTAGTQTVPVVVSNGHNYYHVQYYDTALVAAVDDPAMNETAITVFPNPASDFISVEGYENYMQYSVMNVAGQIVCTGKSSPVIDVRGLAAGTYVIVLVAQDGMASRARFVKN